MDKKGSIVVVGTGMIIGSHISIRCKNHITQADVVFSSAHPLMQTWLEQLNPNTRCLQYLYGENKPRLETYQEMVEVMMAAIRAGNRVVGAFYGHPGVFALAPHKVVEQARKEGFDAVMEPGVSAEDCLYADLGIDPGTVGCQHYEASQFLFYRRVIDPSAYLILWQVALAGETSLTTKPSSAQHLQVFVDRLLEDYPADHEVTLYECQTLPTEQHKAVTFKLADLAQVPLTPVSTLVVPPAKEMEPCQATLKRLKALAGQ